MPSGGISRVKKALLAGAAVTIISSTGACAQTLYFAGPGGSTEDRYKSLVIPKFEAEHNVTVQYIASTTTELVAKLEAQRTNQEFDVISLSDGSMLQAEERGFCAPLVDAPVYAELIPGAHPTQNSVGVSTVHSVIAINEEVFAERDLPEPTSWLDLGNPAYEGEMALLSIGSSNTGLHGLVMVARANGGDEANIEPGFTYFEEKIRPNLITVVQSASKLSEMLQTGEISIGVVVSSRASALAAGGAPIKQIIPAEGAPYVMTALCAVAGGDQPELAQQFIQFLVSVEGQQQFEVGEEPVNPKVAPAGSEPATNLVTLDWATINQHKDEWIDRWNREIE